jgi:hypothetical protein
MSARVSTLSDQLTELLATMIRDDGNEAPSEETLAFTAKALDSMLDDEDEALDFPDDETHAHHLYRIAYEGQMRGLAETREVTVPAWAEGRSIECLFRIARIERAQDDLALAFMRAAERRHQRGA